MHRFFVNPKQINGSQFQSTDKELCHQVNKVLKMRSGKKIIFCDNLENEYSAEWTLVSKSQCEANIFEKKSVEDISSRMPVHLYVPPLKNQHRWELILDKGTELGVASFTPLITERTEVTELRKPERLHRIIAEAAEQSGRTKLPQLNEPITLDQLLSIPMPSDNINFIASLHESSQCLSEALKQAHQEMNMTKIGYHIFIGPVGDFTEEEVQKAIEHNFYSITLGSQVLRTETAAIVSAALLLSKG